MYDNKIVQKDKMIRQKNFGFYEWDFMRLKSLYAEKIYSFLYDIPIA